MKTKTINKPTIVKGNLYIKADRVTLNENIYVGGDLYVNGIKLSNDTKRTSNIMEFINRLDSRKIIVDL